MTPADPTDAAPRADAPLLLAEKLGKTYEESFTLGPVDLALPAGATVAFLGKNGSGKSTLFELLTGNLDATAGSVRLGGKPLRPDTPELKRQLGYLPQNHGLPRWVTGREILSYAARLYELPRPSERVAEAEAYWDCASYANAPLATLSYGMGKRVALALATLHDPVCLILDEPFSGLDLFHIKALDAKIAARAAAGRLTILSTHVAPYTAGLCDRVYIIEAGQVRTLDGWQGTDYLQRIDMIERAFFGPAPGSHSR
jgi:ABC-type multidrug transport system ATPase subunit